ncbi:MAG: ADP-ribosyltransferase [Candidatus Gastranaerophilales bacterium]|nr:ADP-ribosyltransferase [Candidatus Gastranaerophilales bacterium]
MQPNKTYYFGANVPFCTLPAITANKGARAIDTRNISSKKWEEELLFDRNQELKIEKIRYDKGQKIWKITAKINVKTK